MHALAGRANHAGLQPSKSSRSTHPSTGLPAFSGGKARPSGIAVPIADATSLLGGQLPHLPIRTREGKWEAKNRREFPGGFQSNSKRAPIAETTTLF